LTVPELIPVIETAIGPVILISGVGLLILSMTNRVGRVIDRTRALCDRKEKEGCTDGIISDQLIILMRRARLIRLSIILVSMSALAAAVLIIVLFLSAYLRIDSAALITMLFLGGLICLILSLIVFILDMNLSLSALNVQVKRRG
jgi:hypothetical protein